MALTIKQVHTPAELKTFIRFNYELYKDNPYSVPDLEHDLLGVFDPKKNAAFAFCEAALFLAYDADRVVGRVAAIINQRANATWHKQEVRFGWIDFVDDRAVAALLLDTVAEWGRTRGMTALVGPLGFTDMDPEGMLIEGFEELSTMATIYNYPYYPKHLEALGFEKAVDWVEFKIQVPKAIPEKMLRVAQIVQSKFGLRVRKLTSKKELIRTGEAHKIFELINEAYKPLFGFSEMTKGQIDQYVSQYISVIDLQMVTIIDDADGNMVGVGITMPSMSRALQKAKGKLFPFGWWHLLKALKWQKDEIVDLLLVAIKPEYQSKGANALLFADLIPVFQKLGFKYSETNPELELNDKVQKQWEYFDTQLHKRRRCYQRAINA
ncbi:MAG: N-acetyltransferase [Bacteroidales bacterium]|nr:N-acetyltransferase [Bacteroidales bacterium]